MLPGRHRALAQEAPRGQTNEHPNPDDKSAQTAHRVQQVSSPSEQHSEIYQAAWLLLPTGQKYCPVRWLSRPSPAPTFASDTPFHTVGCVQEFLGFPGPRVACGSIRLTRQAFLDEHPSRHHPGHANTGPAQHRHADRHQHTQETKIPRSTIWRK